MVDISELEFSVKHCTLHTNYMQNRKSYTESLEILIAQQALFILQKKSSAQNFGKSDPLFAEKNIVHILDNITLHICSH